MPVFPSPAESAASRANGALCLGPAAPDRKARSARNAARHGMCGTSRVSPEDAAALADLREALTARLVPADPVEQHWVGEIAFALWQQQKLQALTTTVLAHAENGTDEPEPARLPSLATLARYRARIERDLRLARQELEAARQSRPRLPSRPLAAEASRMRWLADRIEERLRDQPPANDTDEPEPQAQAEPEPAPITSFCTNEPKPAPAAPFCTNEPAPAPAAPFCTNEPERPRPLNRHERRRLEALGRKSSGHARSA